MPTLKPRKTRTVTRSASAQAKNRAARPKKTSTATALTGTRAPVSRSARARVTNRRAPTGGGRTPGQPMQETAAVTRGRTPGQPTPTAAGRTTPRRRTTAGARVANVANQGKRGIYSERAGGQRGERVGQTRAPVRGRSIAGPGVSVGDEATRAQRPSRRVTRSAGAQRRNVGGRAAAAAPVRGAPGQRGIYSERAGGQGMERVGRTRAPTGYQPVSKKPQYGKRGIYSETTRGGRTLSTAKGQAPIKVRRRRTTPRNGASRF